MSGYLIYAKLQEGRPVLQVVDADTQRVCLPVGAFRRGCGGARSVPAADAADLLAIVVAWRSRLAKDYSVQSVYQERFATPLQML